MNGGKILDYKDKDKDQNINADGFQQSARNISFQNQQLKEVIAKINKKEQINKQNNIIKDDYNELV